MRQGSPSSNGSPGGRSIASSRGTAEVELPSDKAQRFFELAKQLYSLGGGTSIELERVTKELSSSSSFAPRDVRHFCFLAKVFKQSLDYASAIYALRYVLRIDPNHMSTKRQLSELLMKHGQEKMSEAVLAQNRGLSAKLYEQLYNTARVFFDECLLLQKTNSRVWMLKGVCHANLREANDAIEALSRSIHLLTIDVRIYVPWTDKRFENDSKGKSQRQINNLRHQRKADKERHDRNLRMLCEMHVLRGKLYWAAGMTEQGNKDLRLASTLQPEHPEVLAFGAQSFRKAEKMYHQSLECLKEGDLEQALKLVNMALEISADDIKLYIMLSRVQRALKCLPAAYSAIQHATELFTKSSEFDMRIPEDITQQTNLVFNDMALQCAGEGEYEKSIALLNKVISSEKKLSRGLSEINFRFFVNRGDCYRALHDLQAAAADYLMALHQSVSETDAWSIKTRLSLTYYLLATDYFNENEFAPADAALTQAIANNPKVAAYFASRGTCRYYLGAFGEAYADYRRCLELDPSNVEVQEKLRHQFEKSKEEQPSLSDNSSSDVVSSGGFVDMQRQIVEAMSKLKPSTNDVVDMMLNPRKTHDLPDIHKLVKTASKIALHEHTAAITSTPQQLPVVNPRLTGAFLASQDANEANLKTQSILQSKYDTQKGAMWSVLDNAKRMAQARCRPAAKPESEAEKQMRKTGKEKSYTVAGLKRYSEEMSKAAMLKYKDDVSFIAGVVTSYDDPFLLSGGAPTKKSNLIIKVSNKMDRKKYQAATDTGVCEVIETEDSPLANVFDAERTAWRKLRAQGDGASVTDELIEQLTRPPPPRPPSSELDGTSTTKPRLRVGDDEDDAQSKKYRQNSFKSSSYGQSRKSTMDKYSSRKVGGGQGGGKMRLRVRFSSARDEGSIDSGDASTPAEGFFDGHLGTSRVAQLLADQEDQRDIDLGFGLNYHDDEQSSLLALTEEEELALAAEMRAKAAQEENRRKREARREELRRRLQGNDGVDSPRSEGDGTPR